MTRDEFKRVMEELNQKCYSITKYLNFLLISIMLGITVAYCMVFILLLYFGLYWAALAAVVLWFITLPIANYSMHYCANKMVINVLKSILFMGHAIFMY